MTASGNLSHAARSLILKVNQGAQIPNFMSVNSSTLNFLSRIRQTYFGKASEGYHTEIWLFFLSFYQSRKSEILIYSSLISIQSLFILPILYLTKEIFDTAIPGSNVNLIVWFGIGIVVLRALSSAAELVIRAKFIRSMKHVTKEIRHAVISKLYVLSHRFYTTNEWGVLHSRVIQDTQRIDAMSTTFFSQLVPAAIVCVPLFFIMTYMHLYLTLIILCVGPFIYLVTTLSNRFVRKNVKVFQQAFEGFNKGIYFVLEHMDLTRSQACENQELKNQTKYLEELRVSSEKMAFSFALHGQLQTNVVSFSGIIIIIIGGSSVAAGGMSLGEFIAYFGAASMLNNKISSILTGFPTIITGVESLITLEKLVNSREVEPYKGKHKINFKGNIEISEIGFRYDSNPVFNRLSLVLEPGVSVAIVGNNGEGKSTLVNLILGYYKPFAGALLADGIPYDNLDIIQFRKKLGIVSQHSKIFNGTILENITYGIDDFSTEDVLEATQYALADEFINKLPDKLNTHVGINGSRLSGGEIQKIALTRAILGKPSLLILDEPTNHLDIASIEKILKSLKSIPGNPSIFMISHTTSVLDCADRVFRLSSGELTRIK